jgi:hypothetical protein
MNDIPDPVNSDLDPMDIGRESNTLTVNGKEKILHLAEARGKTQSPDQKD